jgi:hypothetical protein
VLSAFATLAPIHINNVTPIEVESVGQTFTPEETRDAYISTMGEELGPVFYVLYNQTALLHMQWHQFRVLFGTKPERIELLNRASGLFFRFTQDIFWEHTLLHLARLTDRPETGGKRNLTVQALPPLVADLHLRRELEVLIASATEATGFARDWRNRRVAHSDFDLALQRSSTPLALASRAQVETALAAIALVLNRLEYAYKGGSLYFKALDDPGDAQSLLYVLRDGVEASQARLERLRAGTYRSEDLGQPREV